MVGIGLADAVERVPVRAARRQRERSARRDPEQPPLRVEHVEQRKEVVLVGAAAVEQGEEALGLSARRPLEVLQHHCSPNVATTASATTFSGRPETCEALRSRANASCSESPSFAISKPFARSIALRAVSASDERLGLLAQRDELLVPRARGLDRRQEVRLAERLHEIAEHARLHGPRDELVLAVRGEQHDRDRALGDDPPRRLDAVELRHLHVHDREVRLEPARERHRLLAVARLADDVHAGPAKQAPRGPAG